MKKSVFLAGILVFLASTNGFSDTSANSVDGPVSVEDNPETLIQSAPETVSASELQAAEKNSAGYVLFTRLESGSMSILMVDNSHSSLSKYELTEEQFQKINPDLRKLAIVGSAAGDVTLAVAAYYAGTYATGAAIGGAEVAGLVDGAATLLGQPLPLMAGVLAGFPISAAVTGGAMSTVDVLNPVHQWHRERFEEDLVAVFKNPQVQNVLMVLNQNQLSGYQRMVSSFVDELQ